MLSPSSHSDSEPRTFGRAALAAIEGARPYQWLKNLLVFVPLVVAHGLADEVRRFAAIREFVAFCLCASAIYLINDVHDCDADRRHPHKRERPVASGRISPGAALLVAVGLLVIAVAVSLSLPVLAAAIPLGYVALMLAYSYRLKSMPLLDVFVLAGGYALRVLGGGMASGELPSARLLMFCLLVFLSLAFVKRYGELALLRARDGDQAHARGYAVADQPFILAAGMGSGALSVVVLALFLLESAFQQRYSHAHLIWVTCVLLLYWLCHLWLGAHRGRMTDDPLVFVLRDPASRVLVTLMGVTAWLAL